MLRDKGGIVMNRPNPTRGLLRVFFCLLFVLGLTTLTACGTLERLTGKDELEEDILGTWIGGDLAPVSAPENSAVSGETLTVELYFPDVTGQYLVKEKRVIPKTLSVARETVKQWLLGPTTAQAMSPVVAGTTLLDIAINEQGLVTVDLSEEFLQPVNQVSAEARLYGLVNTLAQFPTVERVRLRVEGQNLVSYEGINTTNLTYNDRLVQGAAGSGSAVFEVAPQDERPVSKDSPSRIDLFSFPNSNTI